MIGRHYELTAEHRPILRICGVPRLETNLHGLIVTLPRLSWADVRVDLALRCGSGCRLVVPTRASCVGDRSVAWLASWPRCVGNDTLIYR